jgi:hypothetical protein
MVPSAAAECFVCRKNREQGPLLPGGPVGQDDLVVVSHLAPAAPARSPAAPVPGTPREYWWDRVDEWPGARRGSEPHITELVASLHGYLSAAAQA